MAANALKENLARFKRKYHLASLIGRSSVSFALLVSIYLIISFLESIYWLNPVARQLCFALLLVGLLAALVWGIVLPLWRIFQLHRSLSDEQAASIIGRHFPEINDKLLNVLQLAHITAQDRSLVEAAIAQKVQELKPFQFSLAVPFQTVYRYVAVFGGAICALVLILLISPRLLSESSHRIIHFDQEFLKPAPFNFVLNDSLNAYIGEPYELEVTLAGNQLPAEVFLLEGSKRMAMRKVNSQQFVFQIPNVLESKTFAFEAAGFQSKNYELQAFERPDIENFELHIDYPGYTGYTDQVVNNTGSVIVPEGSALTWKLRTKAAKQVQFSSQQKVTPFVQESQNEFTHTLQARESFQYELTLANLHSANKSKISYDIAVVKDASPEIEAVFVADTLTFSGIYVNGEISDDYGFSDLEWVIRLGDGRELEPIAIEFERDKNPGRFLSTLPLSKLQVPRGTYLEVAIRVKDNDRINGPKSQWTERFVLNIPDHQQIAKKLEIAQEKTESEMSKTVNQSEQLNERIAELEKRLKSTRDIGWQERQMAEELLKEREKIQAQIEQLQAQHDQFSNAKEELRSEDKDLQQKNEQLQQLINETLDPETQQLYEELKKLMEENADSKSVLEKLNQIKNKERNLQKELARAKELFKKLQLESMMKETSQQLNELGNEQEELSQSEEVTDPDAQKEVQQQFEDIQEALEKIEEMNRDLKNPQQMEDLEADEKRIEERLNDIQQDMQNQESRKRIQQKQQNAASQMKEMANKMNAQQAGGEMMMMQENIDDLRDILDNLIKLSFDEETIFNNFKTVQQIDPQFLELSQRQLQLMDNSKVIEDSLRALAERVMQISNFVTREVSEINYQLESAMNELRERNKSKAASHQQFAMTSMNNLALLLDDVLSQMQMALAEAMGMPQSNGESKADMEMMSQMQQQLSEQMRELQKSGKSGRELSEELAKMAAEQNALREQVEELKEQLDGKKGGKEQGGEELGQSLGEIIKKMEANEVDLVNKRLTRELMNRQQEIMTRMLEAEKALREQEESPERKGETARPVAQNVPKAFEDYLKARQKEIELLKTIPLDLNPFYKKEVNEYFKQLSGQD